MTQKLPEPFERKILLDKALRQPVLNLGEGSVLLKKIRSTRKECQAMLKPSMGAGRAA